MATTKAIQSTAVQHPDRYPIDPTEDNLHTPGAPQNDVGMLDESTNPISTHSDTSNVPLPLISGFRILSENVMFKFIPPYDDFSGNGCIPVKYLSIEEIGAQYEI